jgi:hypothetical protein
MQCLPGRVPVQPQCQFCPLPAFFDPATARCQCELGFAFDPAGRQCKQCDYGDCLNCSDREAGTCRCLRCSACSGQMVLSKNGCKSCPVNSVKVDESSCRCLEFFELIEGECMLREGFTLELLQSIKL